MTYIYLIENCYDDPNKVYVGKTTSSRKHQHKKTYGYNIKYTVIDEVNSLETEDWKPIETLYIQLFKSWGFELMNTQLYGGSGKSKHTDDTCLKMSLAKKGKPKPEGFGEAQSKRLKGIKKPSMQGKTPNGIEKAWEANRGKTSKWKGKERGPSPLKGIKMSEESSNKKSEKMKQYWSNKKNEAAA